MTSSRVNVVVALVALEVDDDVVVSLDVEEKNR